jgi:nitrite reductase/ring-hydroxylating ferredoxin subunit
MWTFAMKLDQIRDNRVNRAYPKGIALILIRSAGKVHALSSNCPHMGCSLGGAILENGTVQCPCHDWKFDARTGRFTAAKEIGLASYPVKIENDSVMINL